jgi:hypothetical protein
MLLCHPKGMKQVCRHITPGRTRLGARRTAHLLTHMNDTTYLRKNQAAAFMGISPRRVLELASRGDLRSRVVTDTRSRQQTKEVLKADCQKYMDSFKRQSVEVETRRPAAAAPLPHASISTDAEMRISAYPLFVDLETAASITGLPTSHLLGAILAGELAARDVGIRPGGRFRVRRSDLQGLAGRTVRPAITAG